nr:MAG TPA: hypothetical protein [Caudoviricetes sp.]
MYVTVTHFYVSVTHFIAGRRFPLQFCRKANHFL